MTGEGCTLKAPGCRVGGAVPSSIARRQCSGGDLTPLQLPVHILYALVQVGLEPAAKRSDSLPPTAAQYPISGNLHGEAELRIAE